MALKEFIQHFRKAKGLGKELNTAIDMAFRGRLCDLLTERMFSDGSAKVRRELLGHLLNVHRGTSHRWQSEAPSYENLFVGLLTRRRLFDGETGGEDALIADASDAAILEIRRRIDGVNAPTTASGISRRMESLLRRLAPHGGRDDSIAAAMDWRRAGATMSDEERELLRDWLIPWLIFHDATGALWRLSDETPND
jgi:hypothetical protein